MSTTIHHRYYESPGVADQHGNDNDVMVAMSESSVMSAGQDKMPVEYSVYAKLTDIEHISVDWDALLDRSRCNRAYSCSKWYLATVELFPRLQPLVFVAHRAGTLAAVLPLWLDPERRLARYGDIYSDHTDIIAVDEDNEAVLGLLGYVLQGNGDYDRVDLGQVKRDSNCVRAAKTMGLSEAVERFFVPGKSLQYGVLDLTCGYTEYMKKLSRKFRLNVHRMSNKAERDGLKVCELRPDDLDPLRLPETFLALHRSRFGEQSDFKSAETWMHKLFPSLFGQRRMRVFAVLNKDRITAIDLGMVARSGMYAYNGGFLPEMCEYDAGKLLIHKAIQQSCEEGLSELDLGWMAQDYKTHWRPALREVGKVQFDVFENGRS